MNHIKKASGSRLIIFLTCFFFVFFLTLSNFRSLEYRLINSVVKQMASKVPIIFVHVGDDPDFFPDYLYSSVRQAAVWNPLSDLHIVMPRAHSNRSCILNLLRDCGQSLKIWFIDDVPLTPIHSRFIKETSHTKVGFRGGFWRFSTERLFALLDSLVMLGFNEAIHLENDNLLYARIDLILPTLRQKYPGLAVEPHGTHATAGFLYVQRVDALLNLLTFMVNHPTENEMQSLGVFLDKMGSSVIGYLPVIAPNDCIGEGTDKFIANFNFFNGLFDGAPHGQYIGGADPRNGVGGPGFVNPEAPFRVNDFEYEWQVDPQTKLRRFYQRRLFFHSKNNACNASLNSPHIWHPLFHLHVHCKELQKFVSFAL